MADWIKVPSSEHHDAYLCRPRYQIALLICWATGEVTRWLFTSVVWRETTWESVQLENTTTVNHEISNCCMQVVWTKCSALACRASLTYGDASAPSKVLRGFPGFKAERTRRSVCAWAYERVCVCVCVLCVAQKARDGEREGEWERERLCGRR